LWWPGKHYTASRSAEQYKDAGSKLRFALPTTFIERQDVDFMTEKDGLTPEQHRVYRIWS
jgi:hypothetical protein